MEQLLPAQRASKIRLAEFIVSRYPVLDEEWKRESSLKHAYRMAMFEAVALGATNMLPPISANTSRDVDFGASP